LAKASRNTAKHLTIVFGGTFLVASTVGLASEVFIEKVSSLVLALLFLLFMIFLHIVFDIVAVAAMSANEVPFHAKAANKVSGAGQAVKIIRNADLVANFCADVVGDVTGTISGALAAGIILDILRLAPSFNSLEMLISAVFLAVVASTTVTGKAFGKTFALTKANEVIFWVGKILATVEATTGIKVFNSEKKRKKRGKKA
jgi:CBS domain containing-hemolysin-like protein